MNCTFGEAQLLVTNICLFYAWEVCLSVCLRSAQYSFRERSATERRSRSDLSKPHLIRSKLEHQVSHHQHPTSRPKSGPNICHTCISIDCGYPSKRVTLPITGVAFLSQYQLLTCTMPQTNHLADKQDTRLHYHH